MAPESTPHGRSVTHLQGLYSVAVSVALALAIEHLVSDVGFPIRAKELPALIALLATLIPFYHGTMRHLDYWYIEREGRDLRRGSLLADFLMLFVEACLFLTLAAVITRPFAFGWTLVILWLFDALWGGLSYWVFAVDPQPTKQLVWMRVNLVAAPMLAVLLLLDEAGPWNLVPRPMLLTMLLVVPLARTMADYAGSWDFYYPRRAVRADKS